MDVIRVEGLTYTYPFASKPALRNLSLSVAPGEFVAVVGANDSGKSTLCYALTGYIPHHFHGTMRGAVHVAGMDSRSTPLAELVTVAGLVFQNPVNQISGARFTVYEEVAFGLENLGVPRAEMGERVDEALALVGLTDVGARSPYALSGGQQQRLALASILAMAPQVLVLDEPTSQLDPLGSRDVFAAVHRLSRRGATIVMAEHKLEWIASFADRVIALADGQIVLDGAPQDVLASPLLEQHGVGRTRFTRAAERARALGLASTEAPLPVTLEEAINFFSRSCRSD
ncbi:MAG: energy-coupling factor ABC transporter ATP-binding protein [Caldilinea sp.]